MSFESLDRALERASEFLGQHADHLARCRMEALLDPDRADAVEATLWALQSPDGAFASPQGGEDACAGVAGTLEALAILDDLRSLDRPEVQAALAYLARAQHADGSWASDSQQAVPPRLVLTGLLGGYLAKTRFVRPAVLDAAGGFLAGHWTPERVKGGNYGALAAFAHFFSNVPHELSDPALQWCGRELERGFRSGRLDAVRTSRVLTLCDAQALPGARVDADQLVPALLGEQARDGGWLSTPPRSPELRVAATLDAVLALLRFTRG